MRAENEFGFLCRDGKRAANFFSLFILKNNGEWCSGELKGDTDIICPQYY